jgi:hypothetical protein
LTNDVVCDDETEYGTSNEGRQDNVVHITVSNNADDVRSTNIEYGKNDSLLALLQVSDTVLAHQSMACTLGKPSSGGKVTFLVSSVGTEDSIMPRLAGINL